HAANAILLGFTATALHQQQVSLHAAVEGLRARFNPDDTVIVTLSGQSFYRYAMFYLPEFTVLRLTQDDPNGGWLESRQWGRDVKAGGCPLGPAVRNTVWLLDSPGSASLIPESATLVDIPGVERFPLGV